MSTEFDQAVLVLSPAYQLKTARADTGMSMNKLCKEAKLSYPCVHDLEHGRTNPTFSTMARLAQEMGLRAIVLLIPAHEVIPTAQTFLERRKKRAKDFLDEKVAMQILLENN